MKNEKAKYFSANDVAQRVGIHKGTLFRWEKEGRIRGVRRDHRGWRTYTEEQVEGIARIAETGDPDGYMTIQNESGAPNITPAILKLQGLDWGFATASTGYMTHSMHPYPAKFIPQIPNALIQELSSVEETVVDIFCGSGTTLVESLLLKRNAVGIDASPIACHISKAKTTRLAQGDAEALRLLLQRAARYGSSVATLPQPNLFNESHFVSQAPRPDHDMIRDWFEPFVVEELAEILSWCRDLPTDTSRTVAEIAFSAIVVAVSKQESDTRYARVEKNLPLGEVFRRFSRTLSDAVHEAEKLTEEVEPRFTCTIYQDNVLNGPDIGIVDLVVCSPPYPNAYSYHLYHASRMIWLGMDQPRFKAEEIGSHRKYSKKGSSAATIDTFRQEMVSIFRWLRHHLRLGRYACFVVGDSTIKGEIFDNADVIVQSSAPFGFVEVARIPRRMLDSRKSFNPAIGKIKDEYVVILQRVANT